MQKSMSMRALRHLRAAVAVASALAVGAGCRGSQPTPKTEGTAPEAVAVQKQETSKQEMQQEPQEAPRNEVQNHEVQREETRDGGSRSQTLGAGTSVFASLQSTVSSNGSRVGDRVVLKTVEAVHRQGVLVIPAGARIEATVTHVKQAGRIKGAAELTLRFERLVMPDGKSYPITCQAYRVQGTGAGKESAAEIGGGAAAGALIGGILGGKKDILSGAAIGAAAGTGVAVATKGHQIVLSAGSKLKVTFSMPVQVALGSSS